MITQLETAFAYIQMGVYHSPVSIEFGIGWGLIFILATRNRLRIWASIPLGALSAFLLATNLILASISLLILYVIFIDNNSKPQSHVGLYSFIFINGIAYLAYQDSLNHGLAVGCLVGGALTIIQNIFDQSKRHHLSLEKMGEKHPDDARLLARDHQRLADAEQKRIVYARDEGTCQICGRTEDDGVTFQFDHIIPWSKGGRTDVENLMLLCSECNRAKSDQMLNPFLAGKKNTRRR